MKIFIVEDEKRTADNFATILKENFQDLIVQSVCYSAIEALEDLKKKDVDLVITDICMPDMNGLELIKRIQALHPAIRIAVLSAYDDFDYVRQAFLLGVKDYLLKPVDRVELARLLHACAEELGEQTPAQESEVTLRMIRKVKQIIKENLGQSITLGFLAECVNLNPQYLSSLFKEATGENLFTYVARKRIEKAKELLAHSELKIYEISEISGYADTKYFSYVFKKMMGITPGEYRHGETKVERGRE